MKKRYIVLLNYCGRRTFTHTNPYGLLEEVSHARGTDTRKDLNKLRRGDAEKGHAGLLKSDKCGSVFKKTR